MTYKRVLPRDLFNEANLLKCIGKLTLMIEDGMIPWLSYHCDGDVFNICQHGADGSLYVANIQFFAHNQTLVFWRPLNSREAWPLMLSTEEDEFEVFNDAGELVLKEVNIASDLD